MQIRHAVWTLVVLSGLTWFPGPAWTSVNGQVTCSGIAVMRDENTWVWNCSPGGCPVTPQLENECNPDRPSSCVGGPKCEDGDPDEGEADFFRQ